MALQQENFRNAHVAPQLREERSGMRGAVGVMLHAQGLLWREDAGKTLVPANLARLCWELADACKLKLVGQGDMFMRQDMPVEHFTMKCFSHSADRMSDDGEWTAAMSGADSCRSNQVLLIKSRPL